MKDIKTFIIVDFVIFLIKVIGGFLTHSYTMITSGVYDLVLILCSLIALKGNTESKKLGVFTILIGILSILSAGGLIAWAFLFDIKKTSLWVILFLIITLVMRYIVSCFYTNVSYQKKKGLLSYGNILSNVDFYNYGIIILALVLMKVSKWVDFLKYAERIGTILLAVLLIVKGIKLIRNSIFKLRGKTVTINKQMNDTSIPESERFINAVKKLGKLEVQFYGGVRVAKCDVLLKDGIGMVDVNSFVVTLQDYLLKISDAVRIFMVDKEANTSKRAKVRSLKADARNSGSRNSKTSTKKKTTKKTNKKR